MLSRLMAYGQWANGLLHAGLAPLAPGLLDAPQPVVFGSIARTAHHVLVIGEVWRAHLSGAVHGYTSRSPQHCPPLSEIATRQAALDAWLVEYAAGLSAQAQSELVRFAFIDGGEGAMTRAEILLHLVNHATYHRGHIVAMLNAAGVSLPSSDLPVFLTQPG